MMYDLIDDTHITICPFEPKYYDAVFAFADKLPVHDLLFLPRHTKSKENAEKWLKSMENRSLMTFIALDGDVVVGAGAIVRKLRGWSAHVAEIRIVVSENVRSKGLGRLLLKHCFAEAIEAGAEKLIGRMTGDKRKAAAVFRSLGFQREATLRKQVRDDHGKLQDLLIYSYHVEGLPDAGPGLGYSEIY
jgi:L-amino acid N-acyltransferase YncA